MPRKFYRILLRRRITVIFLLLLQLALLVTLAVSGSRFSVWVEYGFTFVSILVAFHVVGKNENSAYKLIWVTLILLFPVFGGLLYLFFNYQSSTKRFQKTLSEIETQTQPLSLLPHCDVEAACQAVPGQANMIQYLQKYAGFPIYTHTDTEYLSPGEVKLECLIDTLQKAEKYIFLEYFSIDMGVMWNTVLNILKEKAKNGVEVRVIYDDAGCFLLLPKDYPDRLREIGIQCVIFNPFKPFLTAKQNNRDHRKIAVVDGKYAITGGINLADEYINAKKKFGHWKDAAIILEGKAAWSFTLMFLQLWAMCTKTKEDFTVFYPWKDKPCTLAGDGLVQPYADSPMDNENVGEHVYLQIINNAKKYIYINTPYLVIHDTMISALSMAAKNGVDVRLVTPHQPDKQYVHIVTRSYYLQLIQAGVKIYEYSNGFIHSKTFVSDDVVATVGTANLDFRSLYLSFECGVCLYNNSAVTAIYSDFMRTLEKCQRITQQDCVIGRFSRPVQNILRLLAPLL